MKKICDWCGAVLYEGDTPDTRIHHSICAQCVGKIDQQIDAYKRGVRSERLAPSDHVRRLRRDEKDLT